MCKRSCSILFKMYSILPNHFNRISELISSKELGVLPLQFKYEKKQWCAIHNPISRLQKTFWFSILIFSTILSILELYINLNKLQFLNLITALCHWLLVNIQSTSLLYISELHKKTGTIASVLNSILNQTLIPSSMIYVSNTRVNQLVYLIILQIFPVSVFLFCYMLYPALLIFYPCLNQVQFILFPTNAIPRNIVRVTLFTVQFLSLFAVAATVTVILLSLLVALHEASAVSRNLW